MSSAPSSDAGFTLIEVLCAVVVLSIALVAGFRLISEQTRIAAGLEQRVFAHWVALNTLERQRVGLPIEEAHEMGGIAWRIRSNDSAGPVGLRRIEISVTGTDVAGARLVGYLAQGNTQ